jgi:hypothetical protein
MKPILLFLCFIMVIGNLYADNFDKIKADMSKDEVVKLLGNPNKKLASADKLSEYYIWIKNNDVWCVLIRKNKTTAGAAKIDEILIGLLEFNSSFSAMGEQFSGGSDTGGNKTAKEDPVKKAVPPKLASQIEVTVLEATTLKTWDGKTVAGCRFKIKNNSTVTIYNLSITVYFIDKSGKRFFEDTYYPVLSSSWTDKVVLKPNYSLIYPSEDKYMTADKLDLSEWDEGKIEIEITEIGTTKPE